MRGRAGRRQAFAVAALVTMATLYLWCKVEMAAAAEGMARCRSQLQALREERARLLAQVARQTEPTRIQRLALQELGMVYPSSVGHLERESSGDQD